MATNKIQVVENSDRFHVSLNGYPVLTFLFRTDPSKLGVSRSYAEMNAHSEAYKLAVQMTSEAKTIKLYPQEKK